MGEGTRERKTRDETGKDEVGKGGFGAAWVSCLDTARGALQRQAEQAGNLQERQKQKLVREGEKEKERNRETEIDRNKKNQRDRRGNAEKHLVLMTGMWCSWRRGYVTDQIESGE